MSAEIAITFNLNGCRQALAVPAELRLIDLLRDHFGMTAAKMACGIGRCGACSVLMDDRAVNGCLLMSWQLDGATIITPEVSTTFPKPLSCARLWRPKTPSSAATAHPASLLR